MDDRTQWDPVRYDTAHSFVHEYGSDLIPILDPTSNDRILDVGCGTGHITASIDELGAEVIGIDADPEMIAAARDAHPSIAFVHADACRLPFERAFDAVVSNAALHWIQDQQSAINAIRDALRPGGRFVAELGGQGNVATIVDVLEAEIPAAYPVRNPWYFPSLGEYASLLESNGFEVTYARLFDRPTTLSGYTGLERWLEQFADSFFAPLSEDEQRRITSRVESQLEPSLFDGENWTADYRRLRVVARLPE